MRLLFIGFIEDEGTVSYSFITVLICCQQAYVIPPAPYCAPM